MPCYVARRRASPIFITIATLSFACFAAPSNPLLGLWLFSSGCFTRLSNHVQLRYAMLRYATPCYATHATPSCGKPFFAKHCFIAMLCFAELCDTGHCSYAKLLYAMQPMLR